MEEKKESNQCNNDNGNSGTDDGERVWLIVLVNGK